jgi:DUF1365 family protein
VIPESGLYTGTLRHRRFAPRPHEFSYSLFMAFLDIDRIPDLLRRSWLTGYNSLRWASFYSRDHFGDPVQDLRSRLRVDAARQGISLPDGPIFLLTHLRYMGYCFNPISLFYCYDSSGGLPVVLAEVNSTFGESRNYWLGEQNRLQAEHSLRYRVAKTMHVSPFMGMDMDYEFVLTPPGDRLVAHMNVIREGASFFDATLTLDRQEWTSANLAKVLLRHPWMTAKVIGAIHWEALRLWWKGVPVFTHPDRIREKTPTAVKL